MPDWENADTSIKRGPEQPVATWTISQSQKYFAIKESTLGGEQASGQQPIVAIFFYRAHYLSGNTRVIDSLCEALQARRFNPLPLFLPSLRNPEIQAQLLTELTENQSIDLILNTTGFSLA